MSGAPAGAGERAAEGDAPDGVADWSKMRDERCPHCGAPMKDGGCATCAHELARLGASSRLLALADVDSAPPRSGVMVPEANVSAPSPGSAPLPEAAAEAVTPKISFTAAERSELRALVAAIERRIPRVRRAEGGAVGDLERDWDRLVRAMALGEEPATRTCPGCGGTGMRAATRCGHCWAALATLSASGQPA
ncbi:MAG: hypothetical protein WKG00_07710 [Polyangiaceae bacterium]